MNKLVQASIERLLGGHCAQSALTRAAQATEPDGLFGLTTTRRPIRVARTGWLTENLEARTLLSGYALSQIGFFGANAGGDNPQSTLVVDSNGNFYGTASGGGASGAGTVFEIAKGSSTVTTLVSFEWSSKPLTTASITWSSSRCRQIPLLLWKNDGMDTHGGPLMI